LARYFHGLFGATILEELRAVLRPLPEGAGADGHSHFFGALSARARPEIEPQALAYYDSHIVEYEARLAKTRRAESFVHFKYFQYLALLYSEIFLDRLSSDPDAFVAQLNAFLAATPDFAQTPPFERTDLRRLAYYLATGAGKTLLLHVNLWQLYHYLENGRHPEALVDRADRRREFDSILLITPSEGLSAQHLAEFADSGIAARRFDRGVGTAGRFSSSGAKASSAGSGPRLPVVEVIEIHKIAQETEGGGVSVTLHELGARNLVIVDEGHKGTGSEAQSWKNKQKALSADGFLLEYSATFAQAIGAAAGSAQKELLDEYGKAIIFDYSYRYFYGDGFGKAFRVLNLHKATPELAHELILGGLLIFYQQSRLYADPARNLELRPYGIDKPLWVLLGTSVSRKAPSEPDNSAQAIEERTDVAQVVAFLRRFLEDPDWAVDRLSKIVAGQSGFVDSGNGQDLFEEHLHFLADEHLSASALYRAICADLFHGQGGLEVVELRRTGEIGLRVSAGSLRDSPYFALINIGDTADFRKHLEMNLGVRVKDDVMSGSLFERVNRRESSINLLIGAKKFIEGWSSWRVSSLGLLRVGKGEGSQVIQLFGRGVRLRGRAKSLARSFGQSDAPDYLKSLETLYIVAWNADYLATFTEMLAREGVDKELPALPVVAGAIPPWALVPQVEYGFDPSAETWELDAGGPLVTLDLVTQIVSLDSANADAVKRLGHAGAGISLDFGDHRYADLLDFDALRAALLAHKAIADYDNVFIGRAVIPEILATRCKVRLSATDAHNPASVQRAATLVLAAYLDRFVAAREREAQGAHLDLGLLSRANGLPGAYHIKVHAQGSGEQLLSELETLFAGPTTALLAAAAGPLPRLNLAYHLFNPLLTSGDSDWQAHTDISPSPLGDAQERLARDLTTFWQGHKDSPEFAGSELCFLRSLPRRGLGLFARSGFFPDFILWIRERDANKLRIVFLDSSGLRPEERNGGLAGSERLAAMEKLRAANLTDSTGGPKRKIRIEAYLVEPAGSLGALGPEELALEAEFPVFIADQGGDYIAKILRRS